MQLEEKHYVVSLVGVFFQFNTLCHLLSSAHCRRSTKLVLRTLLQSFPLKFLRRIGGNLFGNVLLARHWKYNCYAGINLNYEKAGTLIL